MGTSLPLFNATGAKSPQPTTSTLPNFETTMDFFQSSQFTLDQFGLFFDSPPDLDSLYLQDTWDFDLSFEPFASCSPNISDVSQVMIPEETMRPTIPSTLLFRQFYC